MDLYRIQSPAVMTAAPQRTMLRLVQRKVQATLFIYLFFLTKGAYRDSDDDILAEGTETFTATFC